MGSDEDQAKKIKAEKERAQLLEDLKLERERLAREAARDAARLGDKFK